MAETRDTTPIITVHRTPTGWATDFAQTADAARIMGLFGTTELPTPHTPYADPVAVRAAVAERNPGTTAKVAF